MIMPTPAGSTSDVLMRFVAQHLAEDLGQPVVVENVVGANGLVGTQRLARSAPDGYTIGMTSNGFQVAAPSLYKKLDFDPVEGFDHLCMVFYAPLTLVARRGVPADNLADFLKYARANPGKLSGGYFTNNTQRCMAELKRAARIDILGVPYKTAVQAILDMKGDRLDFAFINPDFALTESTQGTLKLLAIGSATRWPLVPNVPTLLEQLPSLDQAAMISWVGLAAPAGTPKPINARLEAAMQRVMAKAEIKERFKQTGIDPVFEPGAGIANRIKSEIQSFAAFAKEAGIDPQ
jgi:tripartite-type tricarboxylate transporter receptor subunit TctC